MSEIVCGVLLAGGCGERFWPVSRLARPKHLWDITGTGSCLLEQSFRRLSRVVPEERILVVTNAEQREGILRHCPFISEKNLIVEPEGRDTLAAVGLGTLLSEHLCGTEEALVATLPSDHVIRDAEGFSRTVRRAFEIASIGNSLVTIGIRPTFPATGFGYIRSGAAFGSGFDVQKFHEKPGLETARSYLSAGGYYWNAGMFFWKASSFKAAVRRHAPDFFMTCEEMASRLRSGEELDSVLRELYPRIEKRSVDFALMEKASEAKVVPAEFDWDDVGTWTAAGRHLPVDASGNAHCGKAFAEESSGNIVFDATRGGRTTALFGAKDLIVVHTEDATLICPKSEAERLKGFVRGLPREYR